MCKLAAGASPHVTLKWSMVRLVLLTTSSMSGRADSSCTLHGSTHPRPSGSPTNQLLYPPEPLIQAAWVPLICAAKSFSCAERIRTRLEAEKLLLQKACAAKKVLGESKYSQHCPAT